VKKIVTLILVLFLTTPVFAQDMTTLNDDSVKLFLDLFPKYKGMAEEMGQNSPLAQTIAKVAAQKNELETLFESHGITYEEFAALTTKVMIGFTSLQMEEKGMAADPMGLAQIANTSAEEMGVLRKYNDELATLLNYDLNEE